MTDTRKKQLTNSRGAQRPPAGLAAFTLVELLVVVSIIALLVAILVPALSGVRTRAKTVATKSQITSLSTALEAFKQESALGGTFPPSQSDDDPAAAPPSDSIADPFALTGTVKHTTGASLLLYALQGADGLGTPGFPDLDGNGKWSNDLSMQNTTAPYGAYAIGSSGAQQGNPLVPRFGPYASSDALVKSIKSISQLVDEGVYESPTGTPAWGADDLKHRVFTDSWTRPILYYRARAGARAVVPVLNPVQPGIYNPWDNIAITGKWTQAGAVDTYEGLHLPGGAAKKPHWLGYFRQDVKPIDPATKLSQPEYENSFERYIWDKTVTARPTPVNKDTYLLISSGADGLYGTADDVANFERQ